MSNKIPWGEKAKRRKERALIDQNQNPGRSPGKKKNRGRRKAKKKAGTTQATKSSTKSVRFTEEPAHAVSPPLTYISHSSPPEDEPTGEIRPPSPPIRRQLHIEKDLDDDEDSGAPSSPPSGRKGLTKLDVDEPKTLERSDSYSVIPWHNPGDEGLLTSLDALGSSIHGGDNGKVPSPPLYPTLPFNQERPVSSTVMEKKSTSNSLTSSPPWGPVDSTVTAVMTVEGPAGEGLNGAYIVRDAGGKKWIFKPNDEEGTRRTDEDEDCGDRERSFPSVSKELVPGTSAELVSMEGKIPLKQGIVWGETAKKEQAAYLLDHDHFAGVPMTYALHLADKDGKSQFKYGSLQQWKENIGSTEDHGESVFPTEDVHKIGILDIRLLNLDRHMGNILVAKDKKRGGHQLIPIDHGFILPDFRNISETSFEWLNFRQCKQAFSKETKQYIQKLDIFADARRLKSLDIRDEAVLGSMTSTLLLKRGAQQDLTLHDLGSMIQRRGIGDEKSSLEKMIDRTLEKVEAALQRENGSSPKTLQHNEFPQLERKISTESTDGSSAVSTSKESITWTSPSTGSARSITSGSGAEESEWDTQGREMKVKPRELRKSSLNRIPLSRSKSWAHFNGSDRPSYLRKADEILQALLQFHVTNPRSSEKRNNSSSRGSNHSGSKHVGNPNHHGSSNNHDGLKRSTSEIWTISPLRKPVDASDDGTASTPPMHGRRLHVGEVPTLKLDQRLEEEDFELEEELQFPDEPPTPSELRHSLGGGRGKPTIRYMNGDTTRLVTQRPVVPSSPFFPEPSQPREISPIKRSAAIAIPSMGRSISDASPLLRSQLEMERSNGSRGDGDKEHGSSDSDLLSASPGSVISLSTSPPLGSSPPDPAAQVARDVILPSWTWHDNTKTNFIANGTGTGTSNRGVPLPGRHRWLKLYFKHISKEIDMEIERCLKAKEEEASKPKPKRRGNR